MFAFISLCFTFLLLNIESTSAAKPLPCNDNTVKHVDNIIAKINPLGNSDVDFPENVPAAQKWCKQLVKPITTLDDLNKRCMKGMMKEVVGVVLYSIKKKRRGLCRKNGAADLKELAESGKCVNKVTPQIQGCLNKTLDRFMAMKTVNNDVKIPLACCEIGLAKRCMVNAMNKIDVCTPNHQETLLEHFNGLSGGALKIACNDYQENSEKCNKLKSFKLQIKAGQPRPKSIVLPVIQLFESLDKN